MPQSTETVDLEPATPAASSDFDPTRLSRPEEEAFRSIAAALGARFEGDLVSHADEAEAENSTEWRPVAAVEVASPAPARPGSDLLPAGSEADTFERLLAPVPVPLLILRGETVLFANRAALRLSGYTTPAALIAAGGAEALFRGMGRLERGAIDLFTADGLVVAVRARLSAVPWRDGSALMLILETRESPSARTETIEHARAAVLRARDTAARIARR